MGWLGWTQQQTEDTDMDVIVAAYEARIEMLCFMSGRPPPERPRPAATLRPMTPNLILAMFGKSK